MKLNVKIYYFLAFFGWFMVLFSYAFHAGDEVLTNWLLFAMIWTFIASFQSRKPKLPRWNVEELR